MSVGIINVFKEIQIKHDKRHRHAILIEHVDSIEHLGLNAAVVVKSCQRISNRTIFIDLQSRHNLQRMFMNILNHEHETEIIRHGGFCSAEDQLYPDINSLEVLHLTIKGGGTSGSQIFLQIFRISQLKELLLVLRPDHSNDHGTPLTVLYVVINCILGYFRNTNTVGSISHQIHVH